MNEIKIFENKQFGTVRTVKIDGGVWFVGKDVAEALGYEAARNAIAKHVDEEDKLTHQFSASGQSRAMTIINESGLYSLILSSKLEGAKAFKRWVTSEVLPAIRRDGGYIATKEGETDDEILERAVLLAQRRIAERDAKIKELETVNEVNAPKALFADAVSASNTSILLGDFAKILRQNGLNVGQNRLFELLRNKGFLMQRGESKNMPTQRSMELGLFEVKETTRERLDGSFAINRTTKLTGKGQVFFTDYFLGEKAK